MTDPHEQLTALFTLATEWPGGIENCPWRAECVGFVSSKFWTYRERVNGLWLQVGAIDPQHALDLITAEAERWLDKLGWKSYRSDGVTKYCPPITGQYYSLPEALKYAKSV